MKTFTSFHAQRGITLLVALIMLVLMTLIAISAFNISNSNLKSVANMQTRNEMIAAGNKAVEQLISSSFTDSPAAQLAIPEDINNDGKTDYLVNIATPTCIRASIESSAALSSITLSPTLSTMTNWETLWKIEAVVIDPISGANTTTVRSGVRVLLNQTQKDAVCP